MPTPSSVCVIFAYSTTIEVFNNRAFSPVSSFKPRDCIGSRASGVSGRSEDGVNVGRDIWHMDGQMLGECMGDGSHHLTMCGIVDFPYFPR